MRNKFKIIMGSTVLFLSIVRLMSELPFLFTKPNRTQLSTESPINVTWPCIPNNKRKKENDNRHIPPYGIFTFSILLSGIHFIKGIKTIIDAIMIKILFQPNKLVAVPPMIGDKPVPRDIARAIYVKPFFCSFFGKY